MSQLFKPHRLAWPQKKPAWLLRRLLPVVGVVLEVGVAVATTVMPVLQALPTDRMRVQSFRLYPERRRPVVVEIEVVAETAVATVAEIEAALQLLVRQPLQPRMRPQMTAATMRQGPLPERLATVAAVSRL